MLCMLDSLHPMLIMLGFHAVHAWLPTPHAVHA
jgi:hypothetical protein